jgi:hypothetical protein
MLSYSLEATRSFVMAGIVPAIHLLGGKKDVDARDKAGHDGTLGHARIMPRPIRMPEYR